LQAGIEAMLAARVASAAALAAQPQLTAAQRKVRADAAAAEAASIDADAALICEHATTKVRCRGFSRLSARVSASFARASARKLHGFER
jgi:hypothetical protein